MTVTHIVENIGHICVLTVIVNHKTLLLEISYPQRGNALYIVTSVALLLLSNARQTYIGTSYDLFPLWTHGQDGLRKPLCNIADKNRIPMVPPQCSGSIII